jgi:ribosome-associated protein
VPQDVPILGEMIRLGQLLKLAGVVHSGAETKALLDQGGVTVNGEAEARRGRQLHHDDVVAVGEAEFHITSRSNS